MSVFVIAWMYSVAAVAPGCPPASAEQAAAEAGSHGPQGELSELSKLVITRTDWDVSIFSAFCRSPWQSCGFALG